ncbi:hypothetical protein CEP54_003013 [Fusarium duplospermum]|uniref:F-box domain-containing protein n=1 Tax=Fusarium duplospermum TaxID=1325734 RepID=A0A428QRP4_9HYPO|nr:hypothetical protein CEP54_003013 [Fusarium duplospermum]
MSRQDTYCALCGVLIGYRGFAFETDEYDESRLAENGTGWIRDVWLIRRHPTSHKVTLFGPAYLTGRVFNVFIFPQQDQLRSKVQAYNWSTMNTPIFPLHTSCYDILCKVASPEVIDLEILFELLKTHFPVNSGASLDLDYGAASVFQQDKWVRRHGFEYLVTSPTEIPHVDSLTHSILQDSRLGEQHSFPSYDWVNLAQDGVIRAVPPEVLERIASYLDAKDLCSFRLVSKQFVAATSANSFWRSRVSRDAPWMAEFLHNPDIQHDKVDWRRVYQTLQEIVVEKPSSPYIPGIRNRCRIWGICSSLMDEYHSLMKRQDAEFINPPRIVTDAGCCPITRLRYPVEKPTITKNAGFIRDYGDLSSAQPIICTYWTSSGELAGIGTRWDRHGAPTTIGSKDLFNVCQEFEMPKDDWIFRLIFTIQDTPACTGTGLQRRIVGLKFIFSKRSPVQFGQSQGYKRVLCASESHFTVGIRATWTLGKPLAKLAILEQLVRIVPSESKTRLKLEIGCPLSSKIRSLLWKNEVPPDEFHLGYRTRAEVPWDEWLMEPLIFGTTDEELSEMTCIAADVQLGGFEIAYKNGTRRGIGPRRHAMKHLSIDGPDGERITFAWVESTGVRFLTNRGRQLVIGRLGPNPQAFPSLKLHRSRPCCTGHGLAGIFCHWSKAQDLELVEAFSAPLPGVQEARPSIDSHGSYWDPAPPMRRFREASVAYGYRVKYNEETGVVEANSSEVPTVSWLDCEGLLESIRATFCHRTKTSQIPLVALSFRYTDSHVSTVGPSEFAAPDETKQDAGYYTHDIWDIQGSQLKTLRLWTDASQTLTGLQFLAQNGAESPKWGDCETEGPVELDLQTSSGGWAKGLKLFINSNGENAREDYVVVGIQLMEIESPSGSS